MEATPPAVITICQAPPQPEAANNAHGDCHRPDGGGSFLLHQSATLSNPSIRPSSTL